MPERLRWQVALAAIGAVAIGVVLSLFATRTFVDRPARGGRLTMAVTGRPAVLNPVLASKDVEEDLNRLVFAGLTRPSGEGGVEPDLASRWDISDDGLTYRFTLRPDISFHDGTTLTSADVAFTASLAKNARLRGNLSREAIAWSAAEVSVEGDETVTFTLAEPYSPFLAATSLGVLPEHVFRDVPPAEVPQHRASTVEPIGAGPYRLASPGGLNETEAHLVRFDDHWQATDRQPYIDALTFLFATTSVEAIAALGRQEAQAAGGIPGTSITELATETDLYSAPESAYTLVYLNHRRPLYGDASVRRALSLAIDRVDIVTDLRILAGQGITAVGPIPRGSWAFDPQLATVDFDMAGAVRVLEEAGWRDSDADGIRDREGQSLTIVLGVGPDPTLGSIAERIGAAWNQLGVQATVRTLDQQAVQATLSDHSYDAMMFSWTLRDYDPDPFPLWHSSQIEAGQNYGGWSHPRADEILVEARRATDAADRATLYREFMRLFALEQPALVLYHPMYTYGVVSGAVGGVQAPRLLVRPSDRFLTLRDWFVETERVVAGRGRD